MTTKPAPREKAIRSRQARWRRLNERFILLVKEGIGGDDPLIEDLQRAMRDLEWEIGALKVGGRVP